MITWYNHNTFATCLKTCLSLLYAHIVVCKLFFLLSLFNFNSCDNNINIESIVTLYEFVIEIV